MGELPRTVHFQLLYPSGWCGYACIVRLMLQIVFLKNVHSFHLKSESLSLSIYIIYMVQLFAHLVHHPFPVPRKIIQNLSLDI